MELSPCQKTAAPVYSVCCATHRQKKEQKPTKCKDNPTNILLPSLYLPSVFQPSNPYPIIPPTHTNYYRMNPYEKVSSDVPGFILIQLDSFGGCSSLLHLKTLSFWPKLKCVRYLNTCMRTDIFTRAFLPPFLFCFSYLEEP